MGWFALAHLTILADQILSQRREQQAQAEAAAARNR